MHAMQVTVASTLGSTPGVLAFSCNIFLNVPLIADWQTIAQHCKQHVNDNFCCTNRKQCQYDYAPGQQVLKKVHDPTKLGVRTTGPYTIDCVCINGNVSIILHPSVTECINIQRILLYCWHTFHIPLWRYIIGICLHQIFWAFLPHRYLSINNGRLSVAMEGKSAMPMSMTDYGPMG